MKNNNIIQEKSYAFALRIIRLCRVLAVERKEYVLSKQLLRSGTSIGANVEEAIGAQSRKDFIAKMSISYKEARESHYWLRLLRDSGYLDDNEFDSIISDCKELLKLSTSILNTTKQPA